MPINEPLVYILVLHWRGIEHTRACLASVDKLQYGNFKILLVDNGSDSTSGSLDGERLKAEFSGIEVLRLSENRGFSGGCNAGIAYSLDKHADFVWVLNNDTVVRMDTLALLVEAAKGDARAAALSAAVLDSVSSTENTIPGRGVLDFVKGKSLLRKPAGESPVQCEWLAASNLLLRATAIVDYSRKNGVFDERYFLYFEDTELCHRLALAGWTCVFVPKAKISHVGGASTADKHKHWRSYYHTRNRLLFFSSYAPFPLKIFSMASIYLHVLRHRLSLPGKGEDGRGQLKAELLGVRDFERGRFGRCVELD